MPRGGKRAGAGRPKGSVRGRTVEYKTISISARPAEVEAIRAAARAAGKSVSRFLVELALAGDV